MNEFSSKLDQIGNTLWEKLPDLAVTLVVGLILVEVGILILSSILRSSRIPRSLAKILFSLARGFLWAILFLVVIQELGLDNVLVAVTGSSVIVALFLSTGVAPVIADTLAGLSLAADRNFQPGARVQVGSRKTAGHVVTMDMRKTRIRTSDGKVHVIPNSEIDKNEWVILETKAERGSAERSRKQPTQSRR